VQEEDDDESEEESSDDNNTKTDVAKVDDLSKKEVPKLEQ
jgi:hypothetical protein